MAAVPDVPASTSVPAGIEATTVPRRFVRQRSRGYDTFCDALRDVIAPLHDSGIGTRISSGAALPARSG